MEQQNTPYVCADCGHHQDSMSRPCDKCSSLRVMLVSVVKQLFGDDYMKFFQANDEGI